MSIHPTISSNFESISFFSLTAVSLLALTTVQGYHGYLLFAWLYGVFLGGLHLALPVYTLERLRMRHFPRAAGFVQVETVQQ